MDGVDGLFIGPSDLAASLGHLGHNAHPEVRGLITDACRRARAIGTPIGILAPVEADARAFLEMGFQYVAVGSDIGVLNATATESRCVVQEASSYGPRTAEARTPRTPARTARTDPDRRQSHPTATISVSTARLRK